MYSPLDGRWPQYLKVSPGAAGRMKRRVCPEHQVLTLTHLGGDSRNGKLGSESSGKRLRLQFGDAVVDRVTHRLEFRDRGFQAGSFGFSDERSGDDLELQKVKGFVHRCRCAAINRMKPVALVARVRQKQYRCVMVELSNIRAKVGARSIGKAIVNDVQVVNLISSQH